jgi:hypothetical protein
MGEKHLKRLKHVWLRIGLGAAAAALLLGGCADPGQLIPSAGAGGAPGVALLPQFQWHLEPRAGQAELAIPTTSRTPGPRISVHATHQIGFGAPIQGAQAMQTAAAVGQQVVATEVGQLKAKGWQPLFTPIVTGSYPSYVLYVTLRSGSHYCFVEYSANTLTPRQASQELDLYHT